MHTPTGVWTGTSLNVGVQIGTINTYKLLFTDTRTLFSLTLTHTCTHTCTHIQESERVLHLMNKQHTYTHTYIYTCTHLQESERVLHVMYECKLEPKIHTNFCSQTHALSSLSHSHIHTHIHAHTTGVWTGTSLNEGVQIGTIGFMGQILYRCMWACSCEWRRSTNVFECKYDYIYIYIYIYIYYNLNVSMIMYYCLNVRMIIYYYLNVYDYICIYIYIYFCLNVSMMIYHCLNLSMIMYYYSNMSMFLYILLFKDKYDYALLFECEYVLYTYHYVNVSMI